MKISDERIKEMKILALKQSRTDDEDVKELNDKEIQSLKPLHNKEMYHPTKQMISFRIDSDVLYAFKSLGKGYQTKMNAVLRYAVKQGLIK